MPHKTDPLLLAVLSNRMERIVREMSNTLLRAGRSGVLNIARDFSCAIVTRDNELLAAAESLSGSEFPLLLTWAPDDRWFPIRYAERLAREVGGAKLVEIPDSSTFVPLDQPQLLAAQIADFAPLQ